MRTVGLLLDWVGSYGRSVFQGIVRYASVTGAFNCHTPALFSFVPPTELHKWKVDGWIAHAFEPGLTRVLKRRGVPAVNVSGAPMRFLLPTVNVDHAAVGRLAAECLLSNRSSDFAYVGTKGMGYSRLRCDAFVQAVRSAGGRVTVFDRPPANMGMVDPELLSFVAGLPVPVSVYACGDSVARDVINACVAVGRSVPHQVAILGTDNDSLYCATNQPLLCSIDTGADRIGWAAAELIDSLMRGARAPAAPVLLPPLGIVRRGTSELSAADDEEVARALRFVREHASEPITADDVFAEATVGRRSLQDRFRRLTGRTVLQEIHRVRVERAQQLLRETDLPVTRIAERAGFATVTRMGIVFRKLIRQSPSEYRLAMRYD
jgi:LacI family transcriptional regulator